LNEMRFSIVARFREANTCFAVTAAYGVDLGGITEA
jgi:hypothetical protein